jgi:Rod binding domain-containing protein
MITNRPGANLAGSLPSEYNRKVLRAAREFEAQLIGSVFGSLEKTFTSIGAPESDPGAENYQAMAMQALGQGLAAKGGIGIASLISRHLLKPEGSFAKNGHSASS